jgi:flagellar protein FlgJ
MSPIGITQVPPGAASADPRQVAASAKDTSKIRDAAQQFEALLLGQILRSVRESGGGWLGSGGDSSSGCATEFAEQHFASMLAQQGGLGLSDLISQGLRRDK